MLPAAQGARGAPPSSEVSGGLVTCGAGRKGSDLGGLEGGRPRGGAPTSPRARGEAKGCLMAEVREAALAPRSLDKSAGRPGRSWPRTVPPAAGQRGASPGESGRGPGVPRTCPHPRGREPGHHGQGSLAPHRPVHRGPRVLGQTAGRGQRVQRRRGCAPGGRGVRPAGQEDPGRLREVTRRCRGRDRAAPPGRAPHPQRGVPTS